MRPAASVGCDVGTPYVTLYRMPHGATTSDAAGDNGSTWTSWGATQPTLPESARSLLGDLLGSLTPQQPVPIEQATVSKSRLTAPLRKSLVVVVGEDGVLVDDAARARHAGGQSYSDLVR